MPPEEHRDRKPCPHGNDGHRTSVTVAGKLSFPSFVRCTASILFSRVGVYYLKSSLFTLLFIIRLFQCQNR